MLSISAIARRNRIHAKRRTATPAYSADAERRNRETAERQFPYDDQRRMEDQRRAESSVAATTKTGGLTGAGVAAEAGAIGAVDPALHQPRW